MNQWAFVLAAYSVVAITTLGLVISSYVAMRRDEASAETIKRR